MTGLHSPWGELPIAAPGCAAPPPGRTSVVISERAGFFLALVAAAEGRAVEDLAGDLFTEFVVQRATRIGLPGLLDASEFLQGRAEVARMAHNHEVGRSNRSPATIDTTPSEKGRQEVPDRGLLPMPPACGPP